MASWQPQLAEEVLHLAKPIRPCAFLQPPWQEQVKEEVVRSLELAVFVARLDHARKGSAVGSLDDAVVLLVHLHLAPPLALRL